MEKMLFKYWMWMSVEFNDSRCIRQDFTIILSTTTIGYAMHIDAVCKSTASVFEHEKIWKPFA